MVVSFAEEIDDALEHPVDYKSVLQERLARRGGGGGLSDRLRGGPPHDRSFVAVAEVGGQEVGRGEDEEHAEQEAALQALDGLPDD